MKSKKSKRPKWAYAEDSVVHGDCLELLRATPDGVADMVFADPPFNIGVAYGDHVDDDRDDAAYFSWCSAWLDECVRVLKPAGSLFVMINSENVSEMKVIAEGRAALAFGDYRVQCARKITAVQHIVWYYTFGQQCARKFARSHTHVLHFAKKRKFRCNPDSVRVPSARQLIYNDKRANPAGRLPDDTWILRPQEPAANLDDGLSSVQHVPRICGTFNEKRETPNQVPEQLIGRLIRYCTDEGAVVLDPFGGSGTTAAVAKKLGRRYVTFELGEAAYMQARLRVDSVSEGDSLDMPALPAAKPRRKKSKE